jgi:hypothetical protein
MTMEHIGHRNLFAFRPSDFGIRCKISDRASNKRLNFAARDIGGLTALIFPLRNEQSCQTRRVITMRVRDEDLPDLPEIIARLHDPSRHAVAGIN